MIYKNQYHNEILGLEEQNGATQKTTTWVKVFRVISWIQDFEADLPKSSELARLW